MAKILTHQQQLALKLIGQSELSKHFYFTGGTALSHFYLQHRKSEDLDFFSEKEIDVTQVTSFLKSMKAQLKFDSFDFQQSFNRNLFFLHFKSEYVLKLEFTYFPFPQIKQPLKKEGLLIDSLEDIAANKLLTIVQKPRGRDYFDLYSIVDFERFNMDDLRLKAKQKFDWHIDPLQLAARFNQVDQFLDDPIMSRDVPHQLVVNYFQQEADQFQKQIIE